MEMREDSVSLTPWPEQIISLSSWPIVICPPIYSAGYAPGPVNQCNAAVPLCELKMLFWGGWWHFYSLDFVEAHH